MMKIVLTMLLTIAVGAATLAALWGEGMLGFNEKAKAQGVIEEAVDVGGALEVYAISYGEGAIDFGDVTCADPAADPQPDPCEPLLLYIKEKKLLKGFVGDENSGIEGWILGADGKSLEKIVSNEKTCQYINNIKDAVGLDAVVPECGTAAAEHISCCVTP